MQVKKCVFSSDYTNNYNIALSYGETFKDLIIEVFDYTDKKRQPIHIVTKQFKTIHEQSLDNEDLKRRIIKLLKEQGVIK